MFPPTIRCSFPHFSSFTSPSSFFILDLSSLYGRVQQSMRVIEDHKPLVEDLVSTGGELMQLISDMAESDVQETSDNLVAHYDRVKTSIRDHLNQLSDALRGLTDNVSKCCYMILDCSRNDRGAVIYHIIYHFIYISCEL